MPARLRYYFQKAFITPLFVGIILSVIFTAFIFTNYRESLKTNPTLLPIFKDLETRINRPYIETTSGLLFKHFQPLINNLILFKKFYQSMDDKNFPSNEATKDEFIKKYSINGFEAVNNYTGVLKYISRNGNTSFLDHGIWLRDKKITTLDQMIDKNKKITGNTINTYSKKQLFYSTNMLPIFRSILENTGNQTKNSIKQIYMAFENTELFYIYPIDYYKDQKTPYKFFNMSVYPTYCHSPKGESVDFYFFKCQPWWKEMQAFKQNGFDISITMPYTYATDNYKTKGITLCIRFNDKDEILEGDIKYKDTNIAICIDTYLDEINFTLDYFSKNLNGYFFIMRLNSDVPIYYPLTSKKAGQTSISSFEFDFNVTYFLNELKDFKKVKNDFFKYHNFSQYDEINDNHTTIGQFQKNNQIHEYSVVPVPLYLNEEKPSVKTHFFSIVLLMSHSTLMKLGEERFLSSRIITLVVVLFFFGMILVLIGKYLINALADNIVRPLRSLKFIIQGINNKQIIEDKEMTKQEEEIDSKVAREDADISFERTHEIEIFGEMIIKLQNVLKFTTSNKNTNDSMALVKYIYSRYSFQEVSNLKGNCCCLK